MIFEVFKPNKKVSGHAFFVNISRDEREERFYGMQVFFRLVKQSGWNEKTSNGSFSKSFGKDGKDIYVKFGEFEIGHIIRALRTGKPWSTVHVNQKQDKTQIGIKTYTASKGTKFEKTCFSISFTQNGSDSYFISLELGEGENLRVLLEQYLALEYTNRIKGAIKYFEQTKKDK